MASDDISTLIGRVALRDRAAFSALYRQTSPKLFAICVRILRDRAEAEGALQEIYIKNLAARRPLRRRRDQSGVLALGNRAQSCDRSVEGAKACGKRD